MFGHAMTDIHVTVADGLRHQGDARPGLGRVLTAVKVSLAQALVALMPLVVIAQSAMGDGSGLLPFIERHRVDSLPPDRTGQG